MKICVYVHQFISVFENRMNLQSSEEAVKERVVDDRPHLRTTQYIIYVDVERLHSTFPTSLL